MLCPAGSSLLHGLLVPVGQTRFGFNVLYNQLFTTSQTSFWMEFHPTENHLSNVNLPSFSLSFISSHHQLSQTLLHVTTPFCSFSQVSELPFPTFCQPSPCPPSPHALSSSFQTCLPQPEPKLTISLLPSVTSALLPLRPPVAFSTRHQALRGVAVLSHSHSLHPSMVVWTTFIYPHRLQLSKPVSTFQRCPKPPWSTLLSAASFASYSASFATLSTIPSGPLLIP